MRLAMHQLRAPLTIIKGNLSLMKDELAKNSKIDLKEYLEEIGIANEKMLDLINALSIILKLESNDLPVNVQPIDFLSIIEEIINKFEPKIKKKKINLEKDFSKNLPIINYDSDLIKIIFQNIISNAVNYTPENGKIKIKIQKQKNDFLIEVSDNGLGIPENQQSKVFTKFFRADNIIKENDGAGLGLYIVKFLIEIFNGKIWFKSEQNKGTVFSILIPFKIQKGTV